MRALQIRRKKYGRFLSIQIILKEKMEKKVRAQKKLRKFITFCTAIGTVFLFSLRMLYICSKKKFYCSIGINNHLLCVRVCINRDVHRIDEIPNVLWKLLLFENV